MSLEAYGPGRYIFTGFGYFSISEHYKMEKNPPLKCGFHTSAKLIEIQKKFLQGRHGLHELGGQMESNDTLHGSELVPHLVLGPKNSKFGPMGPKNFAQKFLYT